MNSKFSIVFLFGLIFTVLAQNQPSIFDNDNIEVLLKNDRVITNYLNCLLDMGACTRSGRELKGNYTLRTLNVHYNAHEINRK